MAGALESKQNVSWLLDIVESYGKNAALLSGILLALSVFYDYNFLHALGLEFADVPTTVTDHLRTAIIWIPRTILMLCLILLSAILLKMYTVRSGQPGAFGFIKQVLVVGLVSLVNSSVTTVIEYAGWDKLYVFFMIFWLPFLFWVLKRLETATAGFTLEDLGPMMMIMAPMFVAYVGRTGYTDGLDMMQRRSDMHGVGREVVIKTELGTRTCTALGLRRFSAAAIVVGRDRNVTVLPAERILQVRQALGVGIDKEDTCWR